MRCSVDYLVLLLVLDKVYGSDVSSDVLPAIPLDFACADAESV